MKTMKCIKANKPDNFSHRTQWPLENFKFFMNFMVNAANVGFQEKTMVMGQLRGAATPAALRRG